jgi:hypothetical protein
VGARGPKEALTPSACSIHGHSWSPSGRSTGGGITHLLGAWSSATGWGWVRIGRVYAMDSLAGTLDAHLKQCLARATADWVAVMLETAGVVHLDRTPPAKVNLSPNR